MSEPLIQIRRTSTGNQDAAAQGETTPAAQVAPKGRVFWRSLEEVEDPARFEAEAKASDVPKATRELHELQLGRRNFLTLSSAIAGLAGLEGCVRRPAEKILPYNQAPEYVVPGVPLHYATVIEQRGEAVGLVVQSHEGRPTKVEGNVDHPASRGAADLLAQASVLDLYDPDRSHGPRQGDSDVGFAEIDKLIAQQAAALSKTNGEGLRVLAQPSNSPSFLRLRDAVIQRFPKARFHTYAPVGDGEAREGARLAFGQPLQAVRQYDRATVVLAVDSDFLLNEPGSTLAMRGFMDGRRLRSARDPMNRLYVVEPSMSVTGANADHRLRLSADQMGLYLAVLARELVTSHQVNLAEIEDAVREAQLEGISTQWIKTVAKELAASRGRSLVVVGSRQPAAVHALAHAINQGLGNVGRTVRYQPVTDPAQPEPFADIRALVTDMQAGRVSSLFVLGGNPVYDAPADLKFGEALAKVRTSLHLSSHVDETSRRAGWHVPRAHELETWGDQRAFDGTLAIQQPLIAPLWNGWSHLELLARLAGDSKTSGYDLVRETFQAQGLTGELAWRQAVQKGIVEGTQARGAEIPALRGAEIAEAFGKLPKPSALSKDNLEVVFAVDNKVYDGRHVNNPWLLELPDPITRITWDNVAYVSTRLAKELGLNNGDLIRVNRGDRAVDIAAWVLPGQSDYTVTLPLGWGRTAAGKYGDQRGFNVYPLRESTAPHFASGFGIQRLGGTYPLSQTQDHDSMEGRPIAIDATLAEYRETPNFAQFASPTPSVGPLWKTVDYSEGYKWGMAIDLNSCTGCNSCVVACYVENNVPVVGKDEVARGREMSWLRIDRYFAGEVENPQVAFQPVGCQHCEEAPCENVCPVNATAHSPEGLNDIAYNRCIGTRYCMNNCPYKVRRFNFLNFNEDIPETYQMSKNPNVTVRFRGVVEKCSYCVQRVQSAKIVAKREKRTLRDGEVVAACQQACPTQAISFGDLNDPQSKVAKAVATDRQYQLLADVGTRPRTTFLGKIRNPNPEMQG